MNFVWSSRLQDTWVWNIKGLPESNPPADIFFYWYSFLLYKFLKKIHAYTFVGPPFHNKARNIWPLFTLGSFSILVTLLYTKEKNKNELNFLQFLKNPSQYGLKFIFLESRTLKRTYPCSCFAQTWPPGIT